MNLCTFTLCHEGLIVVRDGWTNVSLVEQLSDAMRILTTIAKDRGLAHTTEVALSSFSI